MEQGYTQVRAASTSTTIRYATLRPPPASTTNTSMLREYRNVDVFEVADNALLCFALQTESSQMQRRWRRML